MVNNTVTGICLKGQCNAAILLDPQKKIASIKKEILSLSEITLTWLYSKGNGTLIDACVKACSHLCSCCNNCCDTDQYISAAGSDKNTSVTYCFVALHG